MPKPMSRRCLFCETRVNKNKRYLMDKETGRLCHKSCYERNEGKLPRDVEVINLYPQMEEEENPASGVPIPELVKASVGIQRGMQEKVFKPVRGKVFEKVVPKKYQEKIKAVEGKLEQATETVMGTTESIAGKINSTECSCCDEENPKIIAEMFENLLAEKEHGDIMLLRGSDVVYRWDTNLKYWKPEDKFLKENPTLTPSPVRSVEEMKARQDANVSENIAKKERIRVGGYEILPHGRFIRERVADPKMFDRRSFRTKVTKSGHRIIIGCPEGEWDARKQKCKSGTRPQSILHPMREYEEKILKGGKEENPKSLPDIKASIEKFLNFAEDKDRNETERKEFYMRALTLYRSAMTDQEKRRAPMIDKRMTHLHGEFYMKSLFRDEENPTIRELDEGIQEEYEGAGKYKGWKERFILEGLPQHTDTMEQYARDELGHAQGLKQIRKEMGGAENPEKAEMLSGIMEYAKSKEGQETLSKVVKTLTKKANPDGLLEVFYNKPLVKGKIKNFAVYTCPKGIKFDVWVTVIKQPRIDRYTFKLEASNAKRIKSMQEKIIGYRTVSDYLGSNKLADVVQEVKHTLERRFERHENPYQKLLPDEIRKKLPKLYSQEKVKDPMVQVKFFSPYTNWEWYAIEGEPEGDDFTFFGLVKGFDTELGYFTLSEISIKKGGVPLVERDMHWKARLLSEVKREENPLPFKELDEAGRSVYEKTGIPMGLKDIPDFIAKKTGKKNPEPIHIKYFTNSDSGREWAEENKVDLIEIYYDAEAGQYAVKYKGFPVKDGKHTSDRVVDETDVDENPKRSGAMDIIKVMGDE